MEIQEYAYTIPVEVTFYAFSKEQADEMLREFELDMKKWAEVKK